MDYYEIWCNLKNSSEFKEFVNAVTAYLNYLKEKNKIENFKLKRRKLGFGPSEIGEFNISIEIKDMAQLDNAFKIAALRDGEAEALHKDVYSRIKDFKAGLYRDYPDFKI